MKQEAKVNLKNYNHQRIVNKDGSVKVIHTPKKWPTESFKEWWNRRNKMSKDQKKKDTFLNHLANSEQ
jgi:hypothetical protein